MSENRTGGKRQAPFWLRARWLITAAVMLGLALGLTLARVLPYAAWVWVTLGAVAIAGICAIFAIERDD